MSRNGAIMAMAVLTAGFPKDIPEPTIKLYVQNLQDLPDEVLSAVANDFIRTNRWLPSIAEVRERCLLALNPKAFPPDPEMAWHEITARASTDGRFVRPTWSHPAVGEALEAAGGYYEACMSHRPETVRRRFLSAYTPVREKAIREALRTPAYGSIESRETLAIETNHRTGTPNPDQEDVEETSEDHD